MEDQVEEIKRKTDIVGVIGAYVPLKKLGRHHKGLCPFHSEKTPSFMVNEEMGLYKCFGCGVGGDVIKFLMEIEGIEFRDALERLAEKAGVKLVSRRRDDNDERSKMLEVMGLASRYYHWLLMEGNAGAAAREYLKERKINEKLMETFNLGFAMQSWDGLVNYLIKKKGYSEELLEKVGLVSRKEKGGVYDKFRGRVMFPLQDAGGKVVGFTGRILPALAKEGEPKYMNSPETALYHKSRMLYGFFQGKSAIREKKRAVLVEGQMDCISSFAVGVSETVAVGGTALTEDQIEMIARLADKIYLSMDADEAGSVAIKRSVELAEKRGMSIKVVQLEGGKDPDEIARKSPDKWRDLIENSVDVYEYVMEGAFRKFDVSKVDGVKKITEEVVPFLAKIENGVVREVWAKRLAEKIGVATKGVMGEIEKKISGKQEMKSDNKVAEVEDSRVVKLSRRLIGLLILRQEAVDIVAPWFVGMTVAGAEGKLISWLLGNRENLTVEELVKNIPEELREVAGESYMAEDSEEVPGQKEVEEAAVQLLREIIRNRKKEIMIEMNKARQEKNEEKEDEIFAKLNELNKKESKVIAFLG
ncbi:MAG TPA: DNA primase [Spirochaetia bacterium]|nr:DNA primase [Spirochaetia bacterium]